jgi:hypothetical protein
LGEHKRGTIESIRARRARSDRGDAGRAAAMNPDPTLREARLQRTNQQKSSSRSSSTFTFTFTFTMRVAVALLCLVGVGQSTRMPRQPWPSLDPARDHARHCGWRPLCDSVKSLNAAIDRVIAVYSDEIAQLQRGKIRLRYSMLPLLVYFRILSLCLAGVVRSPRHCP